MTVISNLTEIADENYSKFSLKKLNKVEIIRSSKPYIFIAISKTGSKSIHRSLGEKNDPEPPYYHMSILEAKQKYNLDLKNYFKFAFCRNPYDRIVSLYFDFLLKRKGNTKILSYSKFKRIYNSIFWKSNKNFNLFCKLFYDSSFWRNDIHFKPQLSYILDENGKLSIDFLGKYETLNEDWLSIQEKLGFKSDLFDINKSNREKNYRDYYNNESIKIISEIYKNDIKILGYSF